MKHRFAQRSHRYPVTFETKIKLWLTQWSDCGTFKSIEVSGD